VAGSLAERLQLVVDATTEKAEGKFEKLSAAAKGAETSATATGNAVATAADRVAAARAKEADAAGKVTVAQARLDELLASGTAKASQIAAAEEKVAVAQRQHAIATNALTRETEQQTRTNLVAADSHEKVSRSAKLSETATRGLMAGAAAFMGMGLVEYLGELPQKFLEGARESGQLGQSMNATAGQASQFLVLVQQLGLDLNDLIEIQAEFAQKVGANSNLLGSFGAAVQKNADGTTNWVLTIEDALANLQQIPDATRRNQLGFTLFGEEGYKQLSRLLLSGVDLKDALEQIGTPFTDADIAAAKDYDAAMRQFSLTTGALERDLGRALLPLISEGADLLGAFVEVVTSVPGPIGIATVAALALGLTGFDPLAAAAGRAAAMSTLATDALIRFRFVTTEVGIGAAVATAGVAAMGVAGGVASKALAFVGGPLGVALIALGTAFYFASKGSDDLADHAKSAAVELSKMKGSQDAVDIATRKSANSLEENAGYWERSAAYVKGHAEGLHGWEKVANTLTSPFQRLTMGFGDTADTAKGFELSIEEARKELGAFGAQQEVSQGAVKSLNDLIAEGATGGHKFAEAVKTAADAQNAQAHTSDVAKAAVDAYNATTRGAVQTTYDLISARLASEDAEYGFLDALDGVKGASNDAKTSVDEVAQAHTRLKAAALDAASAAADAAVDAARQAGTILDPLTEANIRADAMVANLRAKLNTPGLTDSAKADLQGLIDQLVTAQDKGDVNALVTLTGAKEAGSEVDQATKDRETHVNVESRGGPAVDAYLDGLANAPRLAIVRVESRGGPDVHDYLARVAGADRLALIRVESRGGPAVDSYLDSLAHERLAIIRVETRGGPDVDRYLDSLSAPRTATINAARGAGLPAVGNGLALGASAPSLGSAAGSRYTLGSVTLDLELTGKVDRRQLTAAERGRAAIADIRAYERDNGRGWRGQ